MRFSYLVFACVLLFLASCKHDKIVIDGDKIVWEDSTYIADIEIPQARNILMEVRTGVQSANSPNAFESINDIVKQFPNRVSVAAMHGDVTLFNQPFNGLSKYDFRSSKAEEVCYSFSANIFPSAMLSREKNSDSAYFDSGIKDWSSRVESLLAINQVVNLYLNSSYDPAENSCELNVKIACAQDIKEHLYLNVYIVESDLKDYQQDGLNKNPNYIHNYVFRDRITDLFGDDLDLIKRKAGTVLKKKVHFKPNIIGAQSWNLENCKIIAFISRNITANKAILHCQEIDLK